MTSARILLTIAFFSVLGVPGALAACNMADAKLEEAILKKPELRNPANRQIVRDLRSLRDAAFVLWSYGRYDDCERLLGNLRELIASPSIGSLGGNDEDEADEQLAASDPMVEKGGAVVGRRKDKNARPLIGIDAMAPALRADEIIGAEVRTSDDKIVGEVRNIIFGTKDRRDYIIVASGGFFVPGKESIVVPIRFLQVSEDRASFYLQVTEAQVKNVPRMPDPDYRWLSDEGWRVRNDALFAGVAKPIQ